MQTFEAPNLGPGGKVRIAIFLQEASEPFKGSFLENFNRNAWDFHKRNLKEYGGVVKLNLFLGVSSPMLC